MYIANRNVSYVPDYIISKSKLTIYLNDFVIQSVVHIFILHNFCYTLRVKVHIFQLF